MLLRIGFSMDAFVKTLILFCYLAFLSWMLGARQIQLYIDPRYLWLTEKTVNALFVLLIVQGLQIIHRKKSTTRTHHYLLKNWLVYLPFIISIYLAFALPSSALDAKLVQMKGFTTRVIAGNTQSLANFAVTMQQDQIIRVTDQNYSYVISELALHPEKYAGKQISINGFVYKDSSFPTTRLALVRYVIFCCSADAMPSGILCQFKEEPKYPVGTWLTVDGTLQTTQQQKKVVPLIMVDNAIPIEEPAHPYIYP